MRAPLERNWIQTDNKDLFELFNVPELGIDWRTSRVLDYGCNVGNYVRWSRPYVTAQNYTGIDLNQASIKIARGRHPGYDFVWYDRYHPSYNPTGRPGITLKDCVSLNYDVTIAFSVFTHCSFADMRNCVNEILDVLNPGGHLLFTFAERSGCVPFRALMKRLYQDYSDTYDGPIEFQNMVYVLNNREFIIDQESYDQPVEKSFMTWYDQNFILREFPGARLHGFRSNQMLVSITK